MEKLLYMLDNSGFDYGRYEKDAVFLINEQKEICCVIKYLDDMDLYLVNIYFRENDDNEIYKLNDVEEVQAFIELYLL